MSYGRQALRGFYAGLAYKGDTKPLISVKPGEYEVPIAGRIYELVVRDTEFQAERAAREAKDLVDGAPAAVLEHLSCPEAACWAVLTGFP